MHSFAKNKLHWTVLSRSLFFGGYFESFERAFSEVSLERKELKVSKIETMSDIEFGDAAIKVWRDTAFATRKLVFVAVSMSQFSYREFSSKTCHHQ